MLVLRPASGQGGTRIDELAFAPDGRALGAPVRGQGVMLWSSFAAGTRAELIRMPAGGGTVRLGFTPDGRLLLGNDQLHVIDLATRAAVRVGTHGPTDAWATLGVAAAPDGTVVVSERVRDSSSSTRLSGWSAKNFFVAPRWQQTFVGGTGLSPAVGPFVPAEPTLFDDRPAPGGVFVQIEYLQHATGRGWQPYRVRRSLDTGAVLDTSAPLTDHVEGFTLSPDGATVAIRVRDLIHLIAAAGTASVRRSVRNDSAKHFTGITFHPSGRFLAVTSNDETVKLYDTTTWDVARTFTWDIGRMRSIAFSPDGTLAAAGSDSGKVVVWDVDV